MQKDNQNPESFEEATSENLQSGAAGSLDERIGELENQLSEAQAAVLYAKAEGENIRRRAHEDIDKARKFALEKFSGELLAVKDSLERARGVEVPAGGAALDKMLEGIDLTIRLMDSIFQKFALAEVAPARGDRFDPEKHQAMSMQESADVPDQHVLMALQKGYLLNGRLLRPALVIVARAPAA